VTSAPKNLERGRAARSGETPESDVPVFHVKLVQWRICIYLCRTYIQYKKLFFFLQNKFDKHKIKKI